MRDAFKVQRIARYPIHNIHESGFSLISFLPSLPSLFITTSQTYNSARFPLLASNIVPASLTAAIISIPTNSLETHLQFLHIYPHDHLLLHLVAFAIFHYNVYPTSTIITTNIAELIPPLHRHL